MLRQSPPLWGYIQHVQIIKFNFKKEQTISIPVKYNDTCTKEINLTPSKRFSDISKFQNFFVKNEKNR